jgi:phosphinothricin acetyltransferase
MLIRPATRVDVEAMLAIYAPIVRDSAISFELEPPTPGEFARRLDAVPQGAPWLVAESGGAILGYAYASKFRERAAYRFTVETTVYVRDDMRRRGVARALYAELFTQLRAAGFATALAVIALPNPASVALHESLGFRPVGVFHRVGFKFDRWHDTGWWEFDLRAPDVGKS